MAAAGVELARGQPRHLCKSDELVPQEDILLLELADQDVLESILADGCAVLASGAEFARASPLIATQRQPTDRKGRVADACMRVTRRSLRAGHTNVVGPAAPKHSICV